MKTKLTWFFVLSLLGTSGVHANATIAEVEKRLSSSDVQGFFKILKTPKKLKEQKVQSCRFSYELGKDIHPGSERTYGLERFVMSYRGSDKDGNSSFESISFTQNDFLESFKAMDYSSDFKAKKLSDKAFGGNQVSTMSFQRKIYRGAKIEFTRKSSYSADKSYFFRKGEERTYLVELNFKTFDGAEIELDSASVVIKSKLKKGKKKVNETIASVTCKNFQ